jgi:hypothetical protein
VTELASEFGGVERLGPIDLVLIRQAAGDVIRGERMQSAVALGKAVDHEELTRVGNSARSALAKLAAKRQRRDESPTLAAYLDTGEAAS